MKRVKLEASVDGLILVEEEKPLVIEHATKFIQCKSCTCKPGLNNRQQNGNCADCGGRVPICRCYLQPPGKVESVIKDGRPYNARKICLRCLKFVVDWVQPVELPGIISKRVADSLYQRLAKFFVGETAYTLKYLYSETPLAGAFPKDLPELSELLTKALQKVDRVRDRFRRNLFSVIANWYPNGSVGQMEHSHPASENLLFVLLPPRTDSRVRPLVIDKEEYHLRSGDGVYFSIEEHALPTDSTYTEPRISLVFFFH